MRRVLFLTLLLLGASLVLAAGEYNPQEEETELSSYDPSSPSAAASAADEDVEEQEDGDDDDDVDVDEDGTSLEQEEESDGEQDDEDEDQEEDVEEEDDESRRRRRGGRRGGSIRRGADKFGGSGISKNGGDWGRVLQSLARKYGARSGLLRACSKPKFQRRVSRCRRLQRRVCPRRPTHPVCPKDEPKGGDDSGNDEVIVCPPGSINKVGRHGNPCRCPPPQIFGLGANNQPACVCPTGYALDAVQKNACTQACPTNSVAAKVAFPRKCRCRKGYKSSNGKCEEPKCPLHTVFNPKTGLCTTNETRCPANSVKAWAKIGEKCACKKPYLRRCNKATKSCSCTLKKCKLGFHLSADGKKCEKNELPIVQCPKGSRTRTARGLKNCRCKFGYRLNASGSVCERDCPKGTSHPKHPYNPEVCVSTHTECPPGSARPFANEVEGEHCECPKGTYMYAGKCTKTHPKDRPMKCDRVNPKTRKCERKCPANSVSKFSANKHCDCKSGYFYHHGVCQLKCPIGQVVARSQCQIRCGSAKAAIQRYVLPTQRCRCRVGFIRSAKRGGVCRRLSDPKSDCPTGFFRSRRTGRCQEIMKECPQGSQSWFVNRLFGEKCSCPEGFTLARNIKRCVPVGGCPKGMIHLRSGKCVVRCPKFSRRRFASAISKCRCPSGFTLDEAAKACIQKPPSKPTPSPPSPPNKPPPVKPKKDDEIYFRRPKVQPTKIKVIIIMRCKKWRKLNKNVRTCEKAPVYDGDEDNKVTHDRSLCKGLTVRHKNKCVHPCPLYSRRKYASKPDLCKCRKGFSLVGQYPIRYCQRDRSFKCPPSAFMQEGKCVPVIKFCPLFSVARFVNAQKGEECECPSNTILRGNVCAAPQASGSKRITVTTVRTVTKTLATTITERLASLSQIYTWEEKASAQSQSQLAAALSEYAKNKVKQDEATTAADSATDAMARTKLEEKAQELAKQQSSLETQIRTLNKSEPKAAEVREKDLSLKKEKLINWVNTIRQSALAELAVEIDNL